MNSKALNGSSDHNIKLVITCFYTSKYRDSHEQYSTLTSPYIGCEKQSF